MKIVENSQKITIKEVRIVKSQIYEKFIRNLSIVPPERVIYEIDKMIKMCIKRSNEVQNYCRYSFSERLTSHLAQKCGRIEPWYTLVTKLEPPSQRYLAT